MRTLVNFVRDYWRMMRGLPFDKRLRKMSVEEMWREATRRAADRQGKS